MLIYQIHFILSEAIAFRDHLEENDWVIEEDEDDQKEEKYE